MPSDIIPIPPPVTVSDPLPPAPPPPRQMPGPMAVQYSSFLAQALPQAPAPSTGTTAFPLQAPTGPLPGQNPLKPLPPLGAWGPMPKVLPPLPEAALETVEDGPFTPEGT